MSGGHESQHPWYLPWSGTEPVSLALVGGFFTTEPPGKHYLFIFNVYLCDCTLQHADLSSLTRNHPHPLNWKQGIKYWSAREVPQYSVNYIYIYIYIKNILKYMYILFKCLNILLILYLYKEYIKNICIFIF